MAVTAVLLDDLAAKLGAKKTATGWMAKCPAHEDGSPSLSMSDGANGGIVVHCHAGCSVKAIIDAMGLEMRALAPPRETPVQPRLICTYPYSNASGHTTYEVVRYEPKTFKQRRPDGKGGYIWSMQGVERLLYRLPAVLEAVAFDHTVYITEGEKDADALTAHGVCATTHAGGAGKWSTVAEHARKTLTEADVRIWGDRDEAGRKHARDVAAQLRGVARSITVVESLKGKDAAEHLAAGQTLLDIDVIASTLAVEVAKGARDLDEWLLPPPEHDTDDRAPRLNPEMAAAENDEEDHLHPSWKPIDLTLVLSGNYQQPMPDYLIRDDGMALLYPGSINGIHGDSGTGKGFAMVYLIAECARRGLTVFMYDFEDNEASQTSRLLLAGLTADQIQRTMIYHRPEVPFGPRSVQDLCDRIRDERAAVTIIDSLGEAFATESLDENKDVEVGPWYRRVARPIAETGTSLAIIDHATKAGDNALFPSGSKRKRAAITGASYLAEALDPFVKGKGGKLRLTCAKDRHGNYRKGEVVGDLIMRYSVGGTQSLILEAPSLTQSAGEVATVPAILAARSAVRAAKDIRMVVNQSTLLGLLKIKCATDIKKGGIDLAVARGALTETTGPRKSRLFEYATDFPDDGATP